MKPVLRILSLGWGVQSWTLAAMMALGELPKVDYAVFADTGHEASGTYAHAKKYTPWLEELGIKVRTVRANETPLVHRGWNSIMIPAFTKGPEGEGQIRRQCTRYWKIKPIRSFLRAELKRLEERPRPGAIESIQGISYDEWTRMRDSDVAYIRNSYPLVDAKLSRSDCNLWLQRHALDVPPKSACTFCPFHSLSEWREQKREGGPDWQRSLAADAELIEAYDDKRKPVSLFLHPARKRLAEAVRISEDYGASQPELGICDGGFCNV